MYPRQVLSIGRACLPSANAYRLFMAIYCFEHNLFFIVGQIRNGLAQKCIFITVCNAYCVCVKAVQTVKRNTE